ncbi:MAG: 16S rRNA processing protein RimM [Rhodospirillaceae bacterium]|nr:MAG: 16S rRNA processing protein RimM [Rhodospirillaceae bacterium]
MQNQVKAGLIPVGVIGAARGLKGDMRVKSYTAAPKSIGSIGVLFDATGTKTFDLKVIGQQKGVVLVRIKGVEDRSAVDALKGQMLYVERSVLPATDEDEFYFSDLQGLDVELVDGSHFGKVIEVEDFGGGPFLEVASANHGRVLIPFTKACVPEVDIQGQRVVIDPPDGLLEAGDPEPQGED